MNKSPLRYPGGKTRAIPILKKYITDHYPGRTQLLSPFLGGGSFELEMARIGYTVVGNDIFKPLYSFWIEVKRDSKALAQSVSEKMPVSKQTFADYRTHIMDITDMFEQAVKYYVVNRTSFSGATFCGGFSQQAADGRLTASSLETLRKTDMTHIDITNMDATVFLNTYPQTDCTVVYADPPYYITSYVYGKDGDLHENFDHEGFARALKQRSDWLLSYNDCEYIRTLYNDCVIHEVRWSYGMNKSKRSSEILILPKRTGDISI